jgi:signal peptidase
LQQSRLTTQEQIDAMRSEILREREKASGKSGPVRKRRWRQFLKVFEWALFLLIFTALAVTLFGVYNAKERGETPAIFGAYMLYSVESGSMEPTLTVGSVIICKKTQHPENLQSNQIVTFHTMPGAVVTHRIVGVIRDGDGNVSYQTKGDNPINSPDEELLTPDRVIGVFAAKIPFT